MFVHAELVDLHASTSVGEPIVLEDDSGTCRWIPLTPSTVHWLSKAPLHILPEHLLSEALNIPSGPISNLHAHHMNSLIESYLSPTGDGGNLVSLDKMLDENPSFPQTIERPWPKELEKNHSSRLKQKTAR